MAGRNPLEIRQLPEPSPGRTLDTQAGAAFGEAADVLRSFQDRMMQGTAQVAAARAEDSGYAAAMSGQPVERRSEFFPSGRVFNEALDRGQVARIGIETRLKTQELAQAHENDPAAFAEAFGIGADGHPTGKGLMATQIKDLPAHQQILVQQNLIERFIPVYGQLLEKAHQKELERAQLDIRTNLNGQIDDAAKAANAGATDQLGMLMGTKDQPGLIHQSVADLMDMGLSAAEASRILDNADKTVARERVLGQFERGQISFGSFEKADPSSYGLDPQEHRTIAQYMHAREQSARSDVLQAKALAEANQRAAQRAVEHRAAPVIEKLDLGIVPLTPEDWKAVEQLHADLNAVGSDKAEHLANALTTSTTTREVATLPYSQAENLVSQVTAGEARTPVDVYRQRAAEKSWNERQSAMANDSATFAREHGIGGGLPPFDPSPEGIGASLMVRRDAANAATAMLGQPVAALSKPETEQLTTMLTSPVVSTPTKTAILGSIDTNLGPAKFDVFHDLAKNGAPVSAYAGYLYGVAGPETSGALLNGDALLKIPEVKTATDAALKLDAHAPDKTADIVRALPNLPTAAGALLSSFKAAYADALQRGTDPNSLAILQRIGGQTENYNGRVTLMPYGVTDLGTFADRVEQVTDQEIEAAGGSVELAAAIRAGQATLRSLTGGLYGVDIGNTQALRGDGRPFVLDFSAIADKPARPGIARQAAGIAGDSLNAILTAPVPFTGAP